MGNHIMFLIGILKFESGIVLKPQLYHFWLVEFVGFYMSSLRSTVEWKSSGRERLFRVDFGEDLI